MSERSQADNQDLELFHDKTLGTGSYGKVCKAKFCELPCAAKILHPVLFQFNDPHSQTILQRFEQECELLKMVRHPNVAQYLGVARDPVSHLPVLLMELLDENLTHFLERSDEPLPYHLQLSLWYDIALALTFLHSKGIIHRDLSGNNVLLIAGSRAKVTDFGMSTLTVINASMSRLTRCPGTPFYMSPEALTEPPVYSKQLDVFSSGVIALQILTRKYPDPSSNMTRQPNPLSPTGFMFMPVPEVQRRKNHIDLIDPHHRMLPMIKSCLNDNDQERPTARQLCHQLVALKQAPEFSQSMQQPTPQERRIRDQQQLIEELQKQSRDLRREQQQVVQQMQSEQQQVVEQMQAEIASRDTEVRKQKQLIEEQQCTVQQMQTQNLKLERNRKVLNTQLHENAQELQLKRRELWGTRQYLQQKTARHQQKTAEHQKELQQKMQELQEKTNELEQKTEELQKALEGQMLQESQHKVKELESKVDELQRKERLVEQLPPAFVTRFTAEQLPPHMKKQIEDCLREWEANFCKFRLFCEHPSSGSLSEKTLEVHRNQTLGEATERAYKVLELQECGVQLEQCQLVRYNELTGTPGNPFDEPKDTPLGKVVGGSPSCLSSDLLMKIQSDDKESSSEIPPHEKKSKERELRQACRLGLLERIPDLLKTVNVNAAGPNGQTPLWAASCNGHQKVAEHLLAAGANPDSQEENGRTPLRIASDNGHQAVVEHLLAAGANPDVQEEDGWTPLKTASSKGHQRVVQLLLAAGADPNLQDKEGWTPLHVASQNGHDKVAHLLLEAGANVEQETEDGRTALYTASRNGHDQIVEELLMRGADMNHQKKTGQTPLWTASFNGHQAVVEILLATGANTNLQKTDGFTALHAACQKGHDRVAEMLLQAGGSLELKTKRGNTPLSIARSRGHEHIVQLLEASRQRTAAERPASVTPASVTPPSVTPALVTPASSTATVTQTPATNTLSRFLKLFKPKVQ